MEIGPFEDICPIKNGDIPLPLIWANCNDLSRRVVTLNGGLVRESP